MSSVFGDTPHIQLATQHVVMNLQKVGATIRTTARLEIVRMDDLYAELAHRLEAYVLAEKLVGDTYETTVSKLVSFDHTEKVPASWWQHFKWTYHDRWWLRWFVNRWQVRLSDVEYMLDKRVTIPVAMTFERYATYPQADLAIPHHRLGEPVIFERVVEA